MDDPASGWLPWLSTLLGSVPSSHSTAHLTSSECSRRIHLFQLHHSADVSDFHRLVTPFLHESTVLENRLADISWGEREKADTMTDERWVYRWSCWGQKPQLMNNIVVQQYYSASRPVTGREMDLKRNGREMDLKRSSWGREADTSGPLEGLRRVHHLPLSIPHPHLLLSSSHSIPQPIPRSSVHHPQPSPNPKLLLFYHHNGWHTRKQQLFQHLTSYTSTESAIIFLNSWKIPRCKRCSQAIYLQHIYT